MPKSEYWFATLSPAQIRFAHATVRPLFSCGRSLADTLEALRQGRLRADDLPTITVMPMAASRGAAAAEDAPRPAKGRSRRQPQPQDAPEATGKKKGRRRRKEEDEQAAEDSAVDNETGDQPGSGAKWYFSLNNRRLYVYKQLHAEGKLDQIRVRVRAMKAHELQRYTLEKCALEARITANAGRRRTGHLRKEGEGEEVGEGDEVEEDEDETEQLAAVKLDDEGA